MQDIVSTTSEGSQLVQRTYVPSIPREGMGW